MKSQIRVGGCGPLVVEAKNIYICKINKKGWCLMRQLLASVWPARSSHKCHSPKKSAAASAGVASAISVKHLRLLGHHCHCSAITLILWPAWPSVAARPPCHFIPESYDICSDSEYNQQYDLGLVKQITTNSETAMLFLSDFYVSSSS